MRPPEVDEQVSSTFELLFKFHINLVLLGQSKCNKSSPGFINILPVASRNYRKDALSSKENIE